MLNFSVKNLRKAAFAFPSIAGACRILEFRPDVRDETQDVKTAEAETRQIEGRAKKATLPKHGHYRRPTASRTRFITCSAISFARVAPFSRTLSMYNLSARISSRRLRIGAKYSQSFSKSCCLKSP